MTTYREYATQHSHIQIDKRVYDREITPDALKVLELYNHIDDDLKDYFCYKDRMDAVVDYYDDNNVSIIASIGRDTPIDVSCVLGDKNRISFDYVSTVTHYGEDRRFEMSNYDDTSKTMDTFIKDLNTTAREVIEKDKLAEKVRRPAPRLFEDDGVEITTTRFDYLVFAERARRGLEKRAEDHGLAIHHGTVEVNLPLCAKARVTTQHDEGALHCDYVIDYNNVSESVLVSRRDHAKFNSEYADGNIAYEFDVNNVFSDEKVDHLNDGLEDALNILNSKMYDNHRWAVLPNVLPEFTEFNPIYDVPNVLDVLGKDNCDVVVQARIWNGELDTAHVRYVWGQSDECKDARATFNLQEFEKPLEDSWRFEGSCHESGVHTYNKCEGTFEDVLRGFDKFRSDFSTKVNEVYTSGIVQDLNDNLEL